MTGWCSAHQARFSSLARLTACSPQARWCEAVAMGEAAIATTAIHNRPRGIPASTASGDDALSFAPQHLGSRETRASVQL